MAWEWLQLEGAFVLVGEDGVGIAWSRYDIDMWPEKGTRGQKKTKTGLLKYQKEGETLRNSLYKGYAFLRNECHFHGNIKSYGSSAQYILLEGISYVSPIKNNAEREVKATSLSQNCQNKTNE